MSEYETIIVAVRNGIGKLTMNRPDSLNALNEKMTDEIRTGLNDLSRDPAVRCVAITGKGKAFSSGQDLRELSSGRSPAEFLRRRYNPIVRLLTGMEKPVVALVNGVAAGAGMSLALACDFRIMSAGAKMVQAFVRIGLVPDSGASFFMPRLLGAAKAFELAALGEDITSQDALRLGIVNRVFPDDDFVEESEKMLLRFASGPTRAYVFIKKLLADSGASSLEECLEREAACQEIVGRTEDALEGTTAFLEKRRPSFKGE